MKDRKKYGPEVRAIRKQLMIASSVTGGYANKNRLAKAGKGRNRPVPAGKVAAVAEIERQIAERLDPALRADRERRERRERAMARA